MNLLGLSGRHDLDGELRPNVFLEFARVNTAHAPPEPVWRRPLTVFVSAPADATAVPEEWDAINSDFDDRDFLVQRGDILVAQLEETGLDDDGNLDVEARDTGPAWLAQVIEDHDTEVGPGLWRYRFRRLTRTTIRQWCVGDLWPPLTPP